MDTDGWICRTNPSDGYPRYRVGFKNTAPWVEEFRNILTQLNVKVGVLYPCSVAENEKPALAFTVNTRSFCETIGFRAQRKMMLANEYFQKVRKRG
jgi:hypothetical protein